METLAELVIEQKRLIRAIKASQQTTRLVFNDEALKLKAELDIVSSKIKDMTAQDTFRIF